MEYFVRRVGHYWATSRWWCHEFFRLQKSLKAYVLESVHYRRFIP